MDIIYKYWEVEKRFSNAGNQNVINKLLRKLKDAGKKKSTVERYRMYLQAFFKDRDELFTSIKLDEINQ